jgi:uncharacterized membrane protein
MLMATLSVWRYPTVDGAEQASETLTMLEKQKSIEIHDAALVSWVPGKKRPTTRQLHHGTGSRALEGSFWGLLGGLLFFVPVLGIAAGAAMGALRDVGIDDDFIRRVREGIKPGTSALFLLTSGAVLGEVAPAFGKTHGELIHTNMSSQQEWHLREAFGREG